MLKYLFSLIISLSIFNAAFSQVKSDTLVYYVKNDGNIADDKGDADYVLFILPQQEINNKKLYPVMAYYPNGKLKLTAASRSRSVNLVIEGTYITYFPNGKRQSVVTAERGLPVGDELNYYPNGTLYTHIKHQKGKTILFECRDSTGTVLAQNGNGNWIFFNNGFDVITSSGPVKDGRRDGEWEIVAGTALYKNDGLIKMLSEKPIAADVIVDARGISSFPSETDYLPINSSPAYEGGATQLDKFVNDNIQYPEEDKKNNISGQVYVVFFVEPDGATTDFKVINAPSVTLGKEALRIAKLLTGIKPAYKKNKPIRAPFVLPVYFSTCPAKPDTTGNKVFIAVDEPPAYPGGAAGFGKFLDKTVRYPVTERESNVTGKVYTTFIVEKDGSLTDMHVISTPSIGLAREMLRVLKLSERWIPGTVNGKPVRVKYTIPMNFSINN